MCPGSNPLVLTIAPPAPVQGASLLRRVQDSFSAEAQRLAQDMKESMENNGAAAAGGDQAGGGKDAVVRLPIGTLFTQAVFRSGFEVLEDAATGERRCVASRDLQAGEAILIEHGLEACSRGALVLALSCDGALREHLWPRAGRSGPPGLGPVPEDIKAEQAKAVSSALARLQFMEVLAAKENNAFIKGEQFATKAGAQAVRGEGGKAGGELLSGSSGARGRGSIACYS